MERRSYLHIALMLAIVSLAIQSWRVMAYGNRAPRPNVDALHIEPGANGILVTGNPERVQALVKSNYRGAAWELGCRYLMTYPHENKVSVHFPLPRYRDERGLRPDDAIWFELKRTQDGIEWAFPVGMTYCDEYSRLRRENWSPGHPAYYDVGPAE